MGMLGTGPGSIELLVVFAAILILFGPERLPGFARALGRIIEQLRSVSSEFRHQIMGIHSPSTDGAPNAQESDMPEVEDDQERGSDDDLA